MMFKDPKNHHRSVFSRDLPGVKIPLGVIDPRDVTALQKDCRRKRAKGSKRKGMIIRVLRRWLTPMKAMREAQAAGKTFIKIPSVAPYQQPK